MLDTKQELRSAQGMLRRRYELMERIGFEESKGEAWNAFQSMLVCVKEVRKHKDNIFDAVDDNTARDAVLIGDVLFEAEVALQLAETNVLKWGCTQEEADQLRDIVFSL